MATRLIVNADDLGLNARIDDGIFEAHRKGIVTSATLLVTGRSAQHAVRQAKEQKLPLGVHLCLTTHLSPAARPSQVRWLAPGGRFRKDWAEFARAWLVGLIPAEEVDRELRAQIDAARALGCKPDHLDSHQHLHLLPGIAPIVDRIAAEEGLPLRWPREAPRLGWVGQARAAAKSALLTGLSVAASASTSRKVRGLGIFEAGVLNEDRLLSLITNLGGGDYELGCHPGHEPDEVPEDPTWRYGWESELQALCSRRVRLALERRNIELIDYGQLRAS
jgi:predicted glycoside hydrolase/deacetylase ChbG (UPF0249 family)